MPVLSIKRYFALADSYFQEGPLREGFTLPVGTFYHHANDIQVFVHCVFRVSCVNKPS